MELPTLRELPWGHPRTARQRPYDRDVNIQRCNVMLSHSSRTNSALRPRFDDGMPSGRVRSFLPRNAILHSRDRHSRSDERQQLRQHFPSKLPGFILGTVDHAVEIAPSDAVERRTLAWDGMGVEVVEAITHDKLEFRFRAPLHLLVVYEEGILGDGETLIEALPQPTLRDTARKLTFVPAGYEYREWQRSRTRSRIVYVYFDPAKMPIDPGTAAADTRLAPRLFFEHNTLWETAVKLGRLIESNNEHRRYCEALGVVLAHELVCRSVGSLRVQPPARGGLAGWQQRIVSAYIEEHMAEQIPLTTLAQLARLSPYHFCRAFKRSLGMPPHRYHNARRIEHAKALLAQPTCSVTEIALRVGFSETSSFTAAFRKATGSTPTTYRRSLG